MLNISWDLPRACILGCARLLSRISAVSLIHARVSVSNLPTNLSYKYEFSTWENPQKYYAGIFTIKISPCSLCNAALQVKLVPRGFQLNLQFYIPKTSNAIQFQLVILLIFINIFRPNFERKLTRHLIRYCWWLKSVHVSNYLVEDSVEWMFDSNLWIA